MPPDVSRIGTSDTFTPCEIAKDSKENRVPCGADELLKTPPAE